jgi:vacuolar-type H+-ATPase subunit D/Vma8
MMRLEGEQVSKSETSLTLEDRLDNQCTTIEMQYLQIAALKGRITRLSHALEAAQERIAQLENGMIPVTKGGGNDISG